MNSLVWIAALSIVVAVVVWVATILGMMAWAMVAAGNMKPMPLDWYWFHIIPAAACVTAGVGSYFLLAAIFH